MQINYIRNVIIFFEIRVCQIKYAHFGYKNKIKIKVNQQLFPLR
jgi:hypothetical protein